MNAQPDDTDDLEVINALKELPPKARAVFCRSVYKNQGYRKIAAAMGLTIGEVEKLRCAANKHMLMRSRSWG